MRASAVRRGVEEDAAEEGDVPPFCMLLLQRGGCRSPGRGTLVVSVPGEHPGQQMGPAGCLLAACGGPCRQDRQKEQFCSLKCAGSGTTMAAGWGGRRRQTIPCPWSELPLAGLGAVAAP